jgi:hypothetical protein
MQSDLQKILTQELKNLQRDIEALEFQLADKRKSLDLLTDVSNKLKASVGAPAKRRSKQPISDMITKILQGRKKPVQPKFILEGLMRAGYVGSPAVMYATLGRLVKSKALVRDSSKKGYSLLTRDD